MRTVLTTLLLAFLFTTTTAAQPGPPDHARPVEGVILVKFVSDALETPPQQLRPSELDLQGREAARLRQMLKAQRGPAQKVFREVMPADTLGRHRTTGEQVRLKDLSRWYRFPVRDTTNVEALASRLEELPLVLNATPDFSGSAARPPRVMPNDQYFDYSGAQWALDNQASDADVDAPEAWSLNTGRSDVTVAVYDVLGRRVTTLHDGPLPAQNARRFRLNAAEAELSSGTYFVRVTGEAFAATRRLTVVR